MCERVKSHNRSRYVEHSLRVNHHVERVLEALPPELGRICHLWIALARIALVAAPVGISRTTSHARTKRLGDASLGLAFMITPLTSQTA